MKQKQNKKKKPKVGSITENTTKKKKQLKRKENGFLLQFSWSTHTKIELPLKYILITFYKRVKTK